MDDEVAFRIEWEGLEVEATCPPRMWQEILGGIGNEMLRLNAALSVVVPDAEPAAQTEDQNPAPN